MHNPDFFPHQNKASSPPQKYRVVICLLRIDPYCLFERMKGHVRSWTKRLSVGDALVLTVNTKSPNFILGLCGNPLTD
jgi:hypothetical protein